MKRNADGSLYWAADDQGGAGLISGTPLRLLMVQDTGTGLIPSLFMQNSNAGTNITMISGSSLTINGPFESTGAVKLGNATAGAGDVTIAGLATVGSNLTVSGVTSLNGLINLGDAAADLVTIRGPVTVMSASSITVQGALEVDGAAKFDGSSITLGDAAADLLTMNAQGTFVGGSTFTAGGVYFQGISSFSTVGKIYIPGANDVTKVLKSNLDGSLTWGADDTGDFTAGAQNWIPMYNSTGLTASKLMQNLGNNGMTLVSGSSMTINGPFESTGTVKLGNATAGAGDVTIAGLAAIGANLTVAGSATISGNVQLGNLETADIHGVNMTPVSNVALAVKGDPATGGTKYVAQFYSGNTLAAWIVKK